MKPLLTTLPTFQGFYESIHRSKIDDAESSVIQDENGDPIPELADIMWQNLNYRKVWEGYAKIYCDNFGELYKIPVRFESLNSPREYNFTTDRIYAYISLSTVKRIRDLTPESTLADTIRQRFTSRDGFSSFYSNDLQSEEWQVPMQDWDANMVSTLLEAYLFQEYSDDEISQHEWDMVDDCNSDISNLVWENLPQASRDEINRVMTEVAGDTSLPEIMFDNGRNS